MDLDEDLFYKGLIWLYIFSTGLFVVSLEPGYLDFDNLPDTNFSCVGKVIGGYYADLETNCQMFHVCTIGQLEEPMDIRFLCLNGTVFDQETRVCERIDEVDCSKSEKFYSLNLELYGNTAPPILEENSETESPIIEKSAPSTTTTTTTTTTTARPTTTTTARTEYFTSSVRPVTPSPYHKGPSLHHFSLEEPPNYTPEEINISLNPGAPPNIRTKAFEFPQHNPYSDNVDNNNKKAVTTSSSVFKSGNNYENSVDNSRISSSTTERERNSFNPNLQSSQSSQNNFKYNFNYHDTRPRDFNPSRLNNYQYHHNYANFRPPVLSSNSYHNNPYRSSTQRNEYLPVSRKNFEVNHPSSTSRSFFLQPIKSPSQQYFRTEKPEGDQLPVPVLPTISPIVFSSPAPFALSRHVETKRYTDEHELPPRIIISASASVSDASGRTLNYSLGTIGAAQILAQPPASYDDYKEEDVVLDPFYHDVPKLENNGKRTKRDTSGNGKGPGQSDINAEKTISSIFERSKRTPQNINPTDIIRSEEEAVEVLKFLFDWYKRQEKTTKSPINIPVSPELISNINEQFSQRPYVSEDYEDDQTETLEKSTITDIDRQQIYSSNYPLRKISLGDSLLQQASRGPSSNINSKGNVFDIRNDPIHSNYKQSEKYEQKNGANNNYHNPPNPSDQTSGFKSKTRGRPNRGRHRFTVPYATTPRQNVQERFTDDEKFHTRKMRVQNPSKPNYEEFYERHTKNNDEDEDSYNLNNDKENREHHFDKADTEFPDYGKNHEPKQQSNAYAHPLTTTQTPALPRLDEIYEQGSEIRTETSTEKEAATIKFATQESPDSVTYATTTYNYSLEDQSIPTDNPINHNITHENIENLVTKTPDYTYYENDVELNKEEAQKTTSKVDQASTDPYSYINTYDYADDNYEPAIFDQHSEGEERIEKNNEDVVRGIIHEETHVNIDLTQKPEESIYDYGNESVYSEETTIHNSAAEMKNEERSSSSNEASDPINTNEFNYIDENVTSFGDILNSLRNFQKYEQDVYNYQNNLTEIKEFEAGNSLTTRTDETETSSSSSIWETTTSNDLPYTQVSNYESKRSREAEDENVPISTTEKRDQDNNISNETEEEPASSTRYIAVVTESYGTKDESQLSTTEPFSLETTINDNFGEVDKLPKYEILEKEFTETTPVSIEQTTYPQNETIIDSKKQINEEDNSSRIQGYKNESDVNESVNDSFEIDNNHDTQKVNVETTTRENEKGIEYTTISSSSARIEEKEDEFISSSPKSRYRGRNRSRQRFPESTGRRIENTPVSNSYRETTGRRRNSRRRQQNKPFYNLEPSTETPLLISTTPFTPTSDDINISEISTLSNYATENIINTEKIILDNVNEKSSYESLPSTHLLNSTPKGFYVTKTKEEREYAEEYPSSTGYKEGTHLITESTEQTVVPRSTEETAAPKSTQETIIPGLTETVVPQSTQHYSEAATESDFSVEETTATILTKPNSNFPKFHTVGAITDIFSRNGYTNTISTGSTSEEITQTTLLGDNLSTESSSNKSTNLTEENTSSDIGSTNPMSTGTEEESSEITKTTTDITTIGTTDNAAIINTFVTTTATYSTLTIEEIEAITNSIVATQSTRRSTYKENYVKNNENLDKIEDDVVSTGSTTESTKDSTFNTEELTTAYQTENIRYKEVQNKDYTTQTYPSIEIETNVSDTQATTIAPSTRIDVITEVNSAQKNEDNGKKLLKSSLENEIGNEQEAPTNRDGRKYDRAQNKPKRPKTSGNRFSSRHRFSSINVTPRNSGSRRPSNSHRHRFGSTADVTQKTTASKEIETATDALGPETSNIQKEPEETLTEISLPKNVKPTLATVKSKGFSTTPMLYKVQLRKERVNKNFVFNCFGKPLNQFYSDPRDCRLFHYCTNGYSKNQLLDMKFVCDLGTHFDDEKLVCTREIPKRCL